MEPNRLNGVALIGQRIEAEISHLPTPFAYPHLAPVPAPGKLLLPIAGGLTRMEVIASEQATAMIAAGDERSGIARAAAILAIDLVEACEQAASERAHQRQVEAAAASAQQSGIE